MKQGYFSMFYYLILILKSLFSYKFLVTSLFFYVCLLHGEYSADLERKKGIFVFWEGKHTKAKWKSCWWWPWACYRIGWELSPCLLRVYCTRLLHDIISPVILESNGRKLAKFTFKARWLLALATCWVELWVIPSSNTPKEA